MQLHELMLHFAAVNNAPLTITSSMDSLTLWVQELACRAYSLSVVTNSLRGWTLQPAGHSIAQILKQLLATDKPTKAAAAAGQAAAGQRAAAAKGAMEETMAKKKRKSQATGKQDQEGLTPPTTKRPAVYHDLSKTAAAAAAAAVQDPGATVKTSSKVNRKVATAADSPGGQKAAVGREVPVAQHHKQHGGPQGIGAPESAAKKHDRKRKQQQHDGVPQSRGVSAKSMVPHKQRQGVQAVPKSAKGSGKKPASRNHAVTAVEGLSLASGGSEPILKHKAAAKRSKKGKQLQPDL